MEEDTRGISGNGKNTIKINFKNFSQGLWWVKHSVCCVMNIVLILDKFASYHTLVKHTKSTLEDKFYSSIANIN